MECDTMPEPLLLTPGETAAILGRDLSQLREWRKRNVGPNFHDLGGGLVRYARESVLTHQPHASSPLSKADSTPL